DLVAPQRKSRHLAGGDVIYQDRSTAAVEVEQVVGDLMPMLQSVQPQKLSSILSTLAGALAGRGAALGQTLTWLGSDVDQFTPRAPTLTLLAKYSPEYPCMLRALTAFAPEMDKLLGKGTNEPGLHVTVNVQPARGKYVPGQDAPVYDDQGSPTCYPVTAAPNS